MEVLDNYLWRQRSEIIPPYFKQAFSHELAARQEIWVERMEQKKKSALKRGLVVKSPSSGSLSSPSSAFDTKSGLVHAILRPLPVPQIPASMNHTRSRSQSLKRSAVHPAVRNEHIRSLSMSLCPSQLSLSQLVSTDAANFLSSSRSSSPISVRQAPFSPSASPPSSSPSSSPLSGSFSIQTIKPSLPRKRSSFSVRASVPHKRSDPYS